MGPVLKSALTVPAGKYFKGARYILTVRELSSILLSNIFQAKIISTKTITFILLHIQTHPPKLYNKGIKQQQEKAPQGQGMQGRDVGGGDFETGLH